MYSSTSNKLGKNFIPYSKACSVYFENKRLIPKSPNHNFSCSVNIHLEQKKSTVSILKNSQVKLLEVNNRAFQNQYRAWIVLNQNNLNN